jgi:hypothetical protein
LANRRKRRRRKGHYHIGIHSSPKAGDCEYRSGWELLFMQHLDADASVASYQYEGICIPYVSNTRSGKLRKYYPDFLVEHVDGRKRLVEIKPKKRMEQARIQKKLKAAEAWCLTHGVALEVITEVELKAMGLLK